MTTSLLCETITGETTAELVAARARATRADMVEIRLDGVTGLDMAQALAGVRLPVIATCRPVWEGGRYRGSEEERRAVLAEALECGAAYVDVEWGALGRGPGGAGFDDFVLANRPQVLLSSHDFQGVPHDLVARARAMRGAGAALVKVAVTAARLVDTLPLLEIAHTGDAVVVGMGEAGVPTRLLASRFGSRWTYGGNGVAPGQMPAVRMIDQFRFRTVGPGTALYGVVGHRATRSPLPVMHNAALAAARLDAVCVPLRAADSSDLAMFADALHMAGTCEDVDVESLPTLVALAERQFEQWTGTPPEPGVMRAAALVEID